MPSFGKKNHFRKFLFSVFTMNDNVNFEDNFLYNISDFQTIVFIQSL